MKNHSRIISILLAMMMVMTSLSIAFALDEPAEGSQGNDPAAVTEETPLGQETGEDPAGDTTNEADNALIDELVEGLERASVTVTINYVDELDEQIAPSVTQEIELKENSEGVYEGSYSVKSPKIEGYSPDKEVVEGIVNDDSASPIIITVTYFPVVTNLKPHPAYNCIILTWDKVENAKAYIVQRSTSPNGNFADIATVPNTGVKEIVYRDGTANGVNSGNHTAIRYYYKVFAVSAANRRSLKPATANSPCVRPMYETIKFEDPVWLTSHDGKNKEIYFGRGKTVVAQGFGGGLYEFWYDGYFFTASVLRFTNCIADFDRNDVSDGVWYDYSGIWGRQNYASTSGVGDNYQGIKFYDKISAENFVNGSGQSSRTEYLIWVSTYTQHLYVFRGSRGNWKLIKDWECSTGAPWSPTPTGFGKAIEGYKSYDDRIPYWCNFQTANSIHGHRSSYTFGSPQSNGCVRNYNNNAKWIYYNCDKGTAVIVY